MLSLYDEYNVNPVYEVFRDSRYGTDPRTGKPNVQAFLRVQKGFSCRAPVGVAGAYEENILRRLRSLLPYHAKM